MQLSPSGRAHWRALPYDQLADLIETGTLADSDLTFAAEELGAHDSPRVRAVLLRLLEHPSAVVREGAIYGLARGDLTDDIAAALTKLAKLDTSDGVRSAAIGALDA
jgi:HEAT repeat protein